MVRVQTPQEAAEHLRLTLQDVIDQCSFNPLLISPSNLGTLKSIQSVLENKIERLFGECSQMKS